VREVDVARAFDADQREVAGAAANVAHEDDHAILQLGARRFEVIGDPGIEGRRGLFEQRQPLDARALRGFHG
jgi:hypothetical protein